MDYILRNFPEIAFSLAGAIVLLAGGLALTMRWALKPLMDTWLRARESAAAEAERNQLGRRVALLESEMQLVHQRVQSLVEAEEFRAQLPAREGRTPASTLPEPPHGGT
jgi:hypothetical protein